jgi:hypothetical protein
MRCPDKPFQRSRSDVGVVFPQLAFCVRFGNSQRMDAGPDLMVGLKSGAGNSNDPGYGLAVFGDYSVGMQKRQASPLKPAPQQLLSTWSSPWRAWRKRSQGNAALLNVQTDSQLRMNCRPCVLRAAAGHQGVWSPGGRKSAFWRCPSRVLTEAGGIGLAIRNRLPPWHDGDVAGCMRVIYESCANDCSDAQHPTIAMGSLLGFPATEEFYSL